MTAVLIFHVSYRVKYQKFHQAKLQEFANLHVEANVCAKIMAKPQNAISPSRHEDFPEWYQQVVKASDLAGQDNLLFIRNSQSGAIEARINSKSVALNQTLHKN